jgi:hypothetical protein
MKAIQLRIYLKYLDILYARLSAAFLEYERPVIDHALDVGYRKSRECEVMSRVKYEHVTCPVYWCRS